ncbi:hypothetical protein Glove_229g127 [Diversispora epigaea]|uniref:Uncharacterized protein n=1 Tax=Diversispora epigaea TaxID=1348612 RepID=A0A397IHM9_9GLOM|nr:hypothetical protein Glove_229g127 [Diversispora epigaea]
MYTPKSEFLNIASITTKPTIDLDTNWSTITEEFAKQMGWKINKDTLSQNTNKVIFSIVKQVSGKIINTIVNPDIVKKQYKVKKKSILNYSSDEDIEEFWMEPESDNESSSNSEVDTHTTKAKKSD